MKDKKEKKNTIFKNAFIVYKAMLTFGPNTRG